MHFPSYLLSHTVLVLGFVSGVALGAPSNRPPAPVVDTSQTPFRVNGTAKGLSFVECSSINTCLIDWLRDGLQHPYDYRVVEGHSEPLHRDHFFELQYIRNALLGHTAQISLDDFYLLSLYANSYNNVFRIRDQTNSYKSKIPMNQWVTDTYLKETYLCATFEGGGLVWDAVVGCLDSMITSGNVVVQGVGNYLAIQLHPLDLHCP